jgi:hypothetical protein
VVLVYEHRSDSASRTRPRFLLSEVESWDNLRDYYDLAVVASEIVAPDRFEPNDDFETAYDLGAITGPAQWTDLTVHDPDDVDFFRFEILPDNHDYRIEVRFRSEVPRSWIHMALFYEHQDAVRFVHTPGTSDCSLSLQGLEAGEYTLLMVTHGLVDHYDLAIIAAEPIAPDRFEGDEILGSDEEGGETWSWTGDTAGWPLGEQLLFARARDDADAWSEAASVLVTVTSWQNPDNPFDVAGNGNVEAFDVLLLVNQINYNGSVILPPRTAEHQHLPYYDVNGDGSLTPLDALMVITHINSLSPAPPLGEGEAVDLVSTSGSRLLPVSFQDLGQERLVANSQSGDAQAMDAMTAPVPVARDIRMMLAFQSQRRDKPRDTKSSPDWDTLLEAPIPELADVDAYFAALV